MGLQTGGGGLYPGGLISGIKYLLANEYGLCPGGLKTGGLNPRSLLEKIVTRSLEGGVNRTPLSTFDTIHPLDLKFGTYSNLNLYFQLSETLWCLINFHGNNSQINDVTGGRRLGFSNFQILFKFSLL